MPLITPHDWNLLGGALPSTDQVIEYLVQISAARCAKTSFGFNAREITSTSMAADLKLYTQLTTAQPMHASPLEHVAQAMYDGKSYGNFRGGWKQLRQILEEQKHSPSN